MISFTLYIAYSTVIKGNLLLPHRTPLRRHCVLRWQNSTPRFALLPERDNENGKYFSIPPVGIQATTVAVTVTPRFMPLNHGDINSIYLIVTLNVIYVTAFDCKHVGCGFVSHSRVWIISFKNNSQSTALNQYAEKRFTIIITRAK